MGLTSNPISIGITATASSALGQAAQGLLTNGTTSFETASIGYLDADLAWQSRFFIDEVHGVVHLFGKPANQNSSWQHRRYLVSTDTWTPIINLGISEFGHMYGNSCLDTTTGDAYVFATQSAPGRLEKWTYATQSWSRTTANLFGGSVNLPAEGIEYIPNCLGAGRHCIVSACETNGGNFGFVFYEISNGSRTQIDTGLALGVPDGSSSACQMVYFPSIGKALSGLTNHAFVTPGATPTIASTGSTPVDTKGYTYVSGAFGHMLQHPGNPAKLLIMGMNSTNCWESTNGSTWTARTAMPAALNFGGARVDCAIPSMGIVWSVGTNSSGAVQSLLWKPAP